MTTDAEAQTPPSTGRMLLRIVTIGVEALRSIAKAIEAASVRRAAVTLYTSGSVRNREEAEKAWKTVRVIVQAYNDTRRAADEARKGD